MSKNKSLIEAILFAIGTILVQITGIWYYWLYNTKVDFGMGEYRIAELYFWILTPAVIFAFGCMFIGWEIRKSKYIHVRYPRIFIWVISFVGTLACIMILTIWYGLPFDASYSWGVNAVMFSKAVVALLPAILCGIAIVAILIATSGNLFLMLFKIIFIVVITVCVYYFAVPVIFQYI
ncbi:MAG: hypothetical protein ACFFDN_00200 [Candidatus Hodarchaeota archaeon]